MDFSPQNLELESLLLRGELQSLQVLFLNPPKINLFRTQLNIHNTHNIPTPYYNSFIPPQLIIHQIQRNQYNIMIKFLLLATLTVLSTTNPSYVKHLHSIESGARCLDGTQAAIYVSPGDPANILMFFNSGGFCEGETLSATLESCYKRSSGNLGSSAKYPDTYDYDNKGILSTVPEVNPSFWNWTKVYVPYCDGSLHQGSRYEPITFKDKQLYFRGTNNTLEHFKFLDEKYKLFKADKIVITGISAGAVATFLWSNYLYEHSESKNIYAIPDSGLFISSFANPYTGKNTLVDYGKPLMELVNNEIDMPLSDCMAAIGNNIECFEFDDHPEFLKANFFIVESVYDEFSLSHILTLSCQNKGNYGAFTIQNCNDTERKYIEDYRQITLKALSNFTKLKNVGFWSPACVQHGFSETTECFMGSEYKVPALSGVTLSEGIGRYMKNISNTSGNSFIDSVVWPNNKGCSEYRESEYLRRGGMGLETE